MDNVMEIDSDSRPTSSRKRTMRELGNSDDEDEAPQADANIFVSPKRSRGISGSALQRRTIFYNAQALLNNLAFTRLYVTANFLNYNPSTSPVLVCIVTHSLDLYHAECQILPRLYQWAPSLQAIGIATRISQTTVAVQDGLERVVPIFTMHDLRQDLADEVEGFRRALGGPGDAIALIDPTGRCVWSTFVLEPQDRMLGLSEQWQIPTPLEEDLARVLVRMQAG